MGRFAPIWNTFNSGELSPLVDGRTDQEKYFAGCKRLRNFIPTVQGPVVRRGGTRYVGLSKIGRAWLVSFEFNQQQSYVLEFGRNYLRFWVNRGQLIYASVPYEIATPWGEADLITTEGTFALRMVQSGDIMWICHYAGTFPPYKLSRLGATFWTLTEVPFEKGPFEAIDPSGAAGAVTATAVTGAITITASNPIFDPADVGTSIYLEQRDSEGFKAWTARSAIALNDIRRWEGNFYLCVAVGVGVTATGDNPPVHTEGRAWDGNLTRVPNDDFDDLGAEWEYLHSGWGIAKITSVVGSDKVLATVIKRLPENVVSTTTTRWALSAFSDTRGWPSGVEFFRERLVFARIRTLYMSTVGDFDDFSERDGPDITAETAVTLKLTSDRLDAIRWMSEASSLLIGTASGEMSVQEQTTAKVFAADNALKVNQTQYGSRLLEPLRVSNTVLFVQRAGRKLREMVYDYSQDRYKADDLTILSEHVLDAGVIDMDFQQEPDTIVWCALTDGTLAALTYNRERGVIAWVPHVIGGGGFVESVATIAAPDGRRDDVWLIVNRGGVRFVEYIEDNRLIEIDAGDAFYGDAGITYEGSPATIITGLDHLNGTTVQILADGRAQRDLPVVSSQVTLDFAASKVQLGYDSPAQLQTMRLDGGTPDGSSQTRKKSISELWLRFKDTVGGMVGPSFDKLDPIPSLNPAGPIGVPPVPYTGDRKVEFPSGYDEDGYVCVQSSPMLPMTIVALIGRAEVND